MTRLLGVEERLDPAARTELERRARELEVGLDRSDFELLPRDVGGSRRGRDGRPDETIPTSRCSTWPRRGVIDLLVRDRAG